jgi:hypothetical protein
VVFRTDAGGHRKRRFLSELIFGCETRNESIAIDVSPKEARAQDVRRGVPGCDSESQITVTNGVKRQRSGKDVLSIYVNSRWARTKASLRESSAGMGLLFER